MMSSTNEESKDDMDVASVSEATPTNDSQASRNPSTSSLLLSTLLSLAAVLILLMTLRYLLPSVLEMSRYSWHRGQLRAEYELAGDQLKRVSTEGLHTVSQSVARRVGPSVVHITIASGPEVELERVGLPFSRRTQGSGVIVDDQGYILTNFHVLDNSERVSVLLADERSFVAELIGVDRLTDLALLKIPADNLMPISWGDSECIEIGSPVWAVGSPFGLAGSITFGILSSKHRLDFSGTLYDVPDTEKRLAPRYSDLMQSDVAVNPGNSGGPLVNDRGELIGINTAIIGETYRGVSFSIPSSVAKSVYEQIRESGRMRRGWLGVELVRPVPSTDSLTIPQRSAYVRNIIGDESPAAMAGLQVGDLITAINGEVFKGVDDLINRIGKSPVGKAILLSIERDEEKLQIEVVVGERPDRNQ